MKLVSYTREGITRIGCVEGNQLIDLHNAYLSLLEYRGELRATKIAEAFIPPNMVEFLQGGEQSFQHAKEAVKFALGQMKTLPYKSIFDISEVRIEAPVLNPSKMICVGHNYREHILEMGRELPNYPVIFAKFSNTIIGPQDEIPFFPISEQLDYEAEFAFVIGKRARNVAQADALKYVAGYTIVNDVTYRDIQRRTIQWLQGKTVEGSAPMGPWLVTADELSDPTGLEVVLKVNGDERQHSNTSNLVFTVPYLIEFLSNLMTLEPGDVILTGTPGGVGVARVPQEFLKDGDIVRIEIDQIGVLENKVKKFSNAANNSIIEDAIRSILKVTDQIVKIVKAAPDEVISWKPSEDKWSVMEVICHVEEATPYWLSEIRALVQSPGSEWGRGLQHEGRLAAVEQSERRAPADVLKGIEASKEQVMQTLKNLTVQQLAVESTSRNPRFGTKPLSFIITHLLVEHLTTHLNQINRNILQYQED